MNRDLDSVLEQSLSLISAGKARVESCLVSYPVMADELEPLLLTAEKLRAMPKPVLSPEAMARIEGRVLEAAAASPALRPAGRRWPAVALPRWNWRWAVSALTALLLFLALMSLTLVNASADALPGSVLYPVKLAAEDVSVWLASDSKKPELHLRYAHRRLAEFETLAERGVFNESVLEDMSHHTEAALVGAERLPPEQALPVLEGVAELAARQTETLSAYVERAPAESRASLALALRISGEQYTRARILMARMRSMLPAEQVKTPEPTATKVPPGQTKTPQPPGQTKTPQPPTATGTAISPESVATARSAEDTNTPESETKFPPGLTKTPQPPGQTKTPEPPGQTKTVEPTDAPAPPESTKTKPSGSNAKNKKP